MRSVPLLDWMRACGRCHIDGKAVCACLFCEDFSPPVIPSDYRGVLFTTLIVETVPTTTFSQAHRRKVYPSAAKRGGQAHGLLHLRVEHEENP